jgi:hypothetical protein
MAKKITAFSKLSKAEKRIVVLKDALKHIKSGFLRPTRGVVVRIGNLLTSDQVENLENNENQLKPILKKALKEKSCEVCQRGGLLLSLVMRDNSFKVCQLESSGLSTEDNNTNTRLQDVFSEKQLAMMETAFEKQYNDRLLGFDLYNKCVRFSEGTGFEFDSEERSIAILKNAIKNGGIFKP